MNAPRVFITGIGLVSPIGADVKEFWTNCLKGSSIVDDIPKSWSHFYESKSRYWSTLPTLDYEDLGISKRLIMVSDRAVLNALVAGDQALHDAGLTLERFDNKNSRHKINECNLERGAIFMGTGLGCITTTLNGFVPHFASPLKPLAKSDGKDWSVTAALAEFKRVTEQHDTVNPAISFKSMANSISAAMSIRYGIKGPNETLAVACAAGTAAVCQGYSAIKQGECDFALVGGSEYYDDSVGAVFMAFDRLGALVKSGLGKSKCNRPFDEERSGFLFSQGASCVLLLESEHHAQTRKARCYAELIGTARNSDAFSLAAMSSEENSIKSLLRNVLNNSGITAKQVDYINAHGTATETNDFVESNVIREFFEHGPYVNSTKSLIGHTIGASGAIETAVTALSLYHGNLHPTLNLSKPICDLNFVLTPTSDKLNYALNQNFGFGGHNVAVMLAAT